LVAGSLNVYPAPPEYSPTRPAVGQHDHAPLTGKWSPSCAVRTSFGFMTTPETSPCCSTFLFRRCSSLSPRPAPVQLAFGVRHPLFLSPRWPELESQRVLSTISRHVRGRPWPGISPMVHRPSDRFRASTFSSSQGFSSMGPFLKTIDTPVMGLRLTNRASNGRALARSAASSNDLRTDVPARPRLVSQREWPLSSPSILLPS